MPVKMPSLLELLKSGVHFGHHTSKWHPNMKKYIFTERSDIHIIDLEKTIKQFQQALDFLEKTAEKGGKILLFGTKKQIASKIKEKAESIGMPYVIDKWVGGTLTNWSVIFRQIKKMKKMEEEKEKGDWEKYTKKEQIILRDKLDRLNKLFGGLRSLEKPPQAVFLVDMKEGKTAILECRKVDIPTVALCDTNADPSKVTYPIPANDDALKALNIMVDLIAEAVALGTAKFEKKDQ